MIDVASVCGGVAAASRAAGGALLGVVAAGFSFPGERSADLKKLVPIFFLFVTFLLFFTFYLKLGRYPPRSHQAAHRAVPPTQLLHATHRGRHSGASP